MRSHIILFAIAGIWLLGAGAVRGDTTTPPALHSSLQRPFTAKKHASYGTLTPEKRLLVYRTLIAEAANQGQEGMYAVGCVMRNRAWNLKGFSGARRKDLEGFVQRQPRSVRADAERVVESLLGGQHDVTLGATHYENIGAFGKPWWVDAGECVQTVQIGSHAFFKCAR